MYWHHTTALIYLDNIALMSLSNGSRPFISITLPNLIEDTDTIYLSLIDELVVMCISNPVIQMLLLLHLLQCNSSTHHIHLTI